LQLASYKVKEIQKHSEEQEWNLSHADEAHQLSVMFSFGAIIIIVVATAVVEGVAGQRVHFHCVQAQSH
jgi:hypothetical protein